MSLYTLLKPALLQSSREVSTLRDEVDRAIESMCGHPIGLFKDMFPHIYPFGERGSWIKLAILRIILTCRSELYTTLVTDTQDILPNGSTQREVRVRLVSPPVGLVFAAVVHSILLMCDVHHVMHIQLRMDGVDNVEEFLGADLNNHVPAREEGGL